MRALPAVGARLAVGLFVAITLDLPLITRVASFPIAIADFLARKEKTVYLAICKALRLGRSPRVWRLIHRYQHWVRIRMCRDVEVQQMKMAAERESPSRVGAS